MLNNHKNQAGILIMSKAFLSILIALNFLSNYQSFAANSLVFDQNDNEVISQKDYEDKRVLLLSAAGISAILLGFGAWYLPINGDDQKDVGDEHAKRFNGIVDEQSKQLGQLFSNSKEFSKETDFSVDEDNLPAHLQKLHDALRNKSGSGYGNLNLFRKWQKQGDWEKFGPDYSHYDWWMFPVKGFKGASATTQEYAVTSEDVKILKNNSKFMADYLEGVKLVCLSWGFDIELGKIIPQDQRQAGQRWKNWPVRLDKMGQSLLLFGQEDLFLNLVIFRDSLGMKPSDMHWSGR